MALTGVNLGGWLLIERWMTPSLFAGTDAHDEYSFMQTPGAAKKLAKHQQTFITESDFAWMAQHGVQAVRIPVGYWVLDSDTPYQPAVRRLDWAFAMAKKYQLQVVLDIHGLPGSQNGHDHSGRRGPIRWPVDGNRQKGLAATLAIARRYKNQPNLWGFQVVNEPPVGVLQLALRRYYHDCYQQLAAILPARVRIIYADAFSPRLMSRAMGKRAAHPTVMDIHWYHFAGWGWLRPLCYRFILWRHYRLITALKRFGVRVIIGEWSGSYAQKVFDHYPTTTHPAMVRQHIAWQQAAYAPAEAWFYWSYKTELPGVWNFRSLVDSNQLVLPT